VDYIDDNLGLIQSFKAARFVLRLEAQEKIFLPEYKGSSFRGVLGWQLKKVICVRHDTNDCSKCLLVSKCLYSYLFSPSLPQETQFLKNTSRIPSPIIIEPPLTSQRHFEQREKLEVSLVLVGKGLEYLPYLIYVFTEMGKAGIGAPIHSASKRKRGGRFTVIEVLDDIGRNTIYCGEDSILQNNYQVLRLDDAVEHSSGMDMQKLNVTFQTPVRFKEMNGNNTSLSKLRSFSQIMANLYWRLLMLSYFHCNPWSLDDKRFEGLSKEAAKQRKTLSNTEDVALENNCTYWQEYERWSNRQNTKMFMGGFMGSATFSGNLTPYLPLLYLGQYTHIGKQTMFGLGKYRLEH